MYEYFWTCNEKIEHEVNLMPKSLDGKIIPVTSFCGIIPPSKIKRGTRFSKGLSGSTPCRECDNEKRKLILETLYLKRDMRDRFTQKVTDILSTNPGDLSRRYEILKDSIRENIEYDGQSRSYEVHSNVIWLFDNTNKLMEYRYYREWEDDVISDQLYKSQDNIYLFNKEDPVAQRVFESLREEVY